MKFLFFIHFIMGDGQAAPSIKHVETTKPPKSHAKDKNSHYILIKGG